MSENTQETAQPQEQVCASENINFDALNGDGAKIAQLETQVAELTDKYYRANADFENLRKRMEKEKSEVASYANEKFARDLLPVLDALEMGANFEPEDGDDFSKKVKEGIEISINEFKKCLEKHGVAEVATDAEFDPNFHNAMMRVDADGVTSGAIVQVFQKGYSINGRVLRPAMVSIAN